MEREARSPKTGGSGKQKARKPELDLQAIENASVFLRKRLRKVGSATGVGTTALMALNATHPIPVPRATPNQI